MTTDLMLLSTFITFLQICLWIQGQLSGWEPIFWEVDTFLGLKVLKHLWGWMGGDKVPIRGTGFGIERHCAAGSGHHHPLRPPNTPKENMLHPPPRLFSTFLVISGVHAGKTPYNTEHLKGFYTERICGTVFTDRCSQISTRIVCGQVYPTFLFNNDFNRQFCIYFLNCSRFPS